tara:strand:- start:69216 stop:69419 length:204 start_codon:yes stop_codon:yes gene_type:complete
VFQEINLLRRIGIWEKYAQNSRVQMGFLERKTWIKLISKVSMTTSGSEPADILPPPAVAISSLSWSY